MAVDAAAHVRGEVTGGVADESRVRPGLGQNVEQFFLHFVRRLKHPGIDLKLVARGQHADHFGAEVDRNVTISPDVAGASLDTSDPSTWVAITAPDEVWNMAGPAPCRVTVTMKSPMLGI